MKRVKERKIKQRAALGRLGKSLTRRSRGRCELCDSRDTVRAWEIPPFPQDPELSRALMTCGQCRAWLEGLPVDALASHFLLGALWSEVEPVRLAAARLVIAAGFDDDPDLRDALDRVDVDVHTGEFRHAPAHDLVD